MSRRKLPLLVQCCLIVWLLITCVSAQTAAAKLRYAFVAGQKLDVVQTESSFDTFENFVEHSKEVTRMSKEFVQSWEVKSVAASGDASIIMQYKSLSITTSPAPGIQIVIDTSRTTLEANPMLAQIGPQGKPVIDKLETARKIMVDLFIPRSYKLVVSDTGEIKSLTGFDEALENYRLKVETIIPDKVKRAEIDASIEAVFGEESIKKVFSFSFFAGLPKQNITVGEEWSNETDFSFAAVRFPIKRIYKLSTVSAKGNGYTIAGKIVYEPPVPTEEMEFKMPGNVLTAEISLDPANGKLLSQVYEGKLAFEVYGRTPETKGLVMRYDGILKGAVRISIAP